MRRWSRSTVGSAVGVVLAASFVVLASPQGPAAASACDLTWDGTGDGTNWTDNGNWVGDIGIPGPGDVVCIGMPDHVVIDAAVVSHGAEVQLTSNAEISVQNGASLFIDGGTESVWGPGTNVAINNTGELGGAGIIRVQGGVWFDSPNTGSVLTSGPSGNGKMIVEGAAHVLANGLGLESGYQVDLAAGGSMHLQPGTWVAAEPGTTTTIRPGATLDLGGDGGYYQSSAAGSAVLTNSGTLVKSGGNGISLVDATYAGAGQVVVQSGILTLPDTQQIAATVAPGKGFATARCDSVPSTSVCQGTANPAKDVMNLLFTVPATNASNAAVQLQELPPVAMTVDPKRIGNEVLAHADNLVPDGAHPARIDIRFSQADVMNTPLGEVQVVHTTDSGHEVVLPSCVNGALPAGLWSCVVRPVQRNSQNTFVAMLTTVTSRWHLRRDLPVENQGAPTAPQGLTVKEAAPFDGSVLRVAWSPPASSGAGPVASYRVLLDGELKASPTGTSVLIKNPGPGKHTIKVTAVSAAGQGPQAAAAVTIDQLSKPRKAAAVRGKAGGDRTAGVTWKPPAEAGGLTINRYMIAIFKNGVGKVDKQKVAASKRKFMVELKRGKYQFRVRAKNADGWGPWSKPTDLVSPR